MDVSTLIHQAVSLGASDLHIVAGSIPSARIDGALQALPDTGIASAEDTDAFFKEITTGEQQAEFGEAMELDFSGSFPDTGRFRCNASRQQGTTGLVIRLISATPPDIETLGLPEVCRELVFKKRGLILVTGPTGSGKSTTLAAMINYLNREQPRRIITVEDPVEYVYTNEKSLITQRELGNDTRSFAAALKHVLRQDPDVILVGEMRDYETASAVLTIAETGHLVLTTGHATGVVQALERVIDLFPADERLLAQSRLATLMVGVLNQVLVPKAGGEGRVAALEILLSCPAVSNTIREGKLYQIPNAMLTQQRLGMVTLDNALQDLLQRGLITRESRFAFGTGVNRIHDPGSSAAIDAGTAR